MTIQLRPCAGEAELSDPRFTGDFASEMAAVAAMKHVAPWCGYVGWDGQRPVGFGGFKGVPDEQGFVELGYLTFPGAQGQGVATGITRELISIAREAGASTILAHTLPEPNASTRVLEKCGFARDGWGEDDDVGKVWRWRRSLWD